MSACNPDALYSRSGMWQFTSHPGKSTYSCNLTYLHAVDCFSDVSSTLFVQIDCGNNSKIEFLRVCICYEIEIISEMISICYAAGSKL